SKISTSYIQCEIQGEHGSILFDDAGSILDMKYIDNSSGEEEHIQTYSLEDNMQYEITNFLQIIASQNNEEYKRLKELSLLTLSITEEARKQNNIMYGSER